MKLTREKLRRLIISEMSSIMRPTIQGDYDDEDEDTEDEETEDDFLHDYLEMIRSGRPYDKD